MKSVKSKLFLISLTSITLTTIIAVTIMYWGNANIIDGIIQEDTATAINALSQKTEAMKTQSYDTAAILARDQTLKSAIITRNNTQIISAANQVIQNFNLNTDFVTITDNTGTVVARTHSDSYGDSVTNQLNITEALKGNSASFIEQGTVVKLSVRSSAPVKNTSGDVIGAISTGYNLDNPAYLDELKLTTGAEFTVFLGDERINTTIEKDGVRQVGTKLSEKVAEIVIAQKQTYNAEADILGNPFQTSYMPILDNDGKEVIGIFFAGIPISNIKASVVTTMGYSIAAVVLLSILLLIFNRILSQKIIIGPIKKISEASLLLSQGNLNIDHLTYQSRDEIGSLSMGIRDISLALQSLIQALDKSSADFMAGNTRSLIHSLEFNGAYREVVESINSLRKSQTDETSRLLDCLTAFGDGDFTADLEKLPGDKERMNIVLNTLRDNLKSVDGEITLLINNATKGNLAHRANADNYNGGWAVLLDNMNRLMEAFAAPIAEMSRVLDQVSHGNFTVKMDGHYEGDFLIIKNSINGMVTSVASYIEEISKVLNEISSGNLDQEINREYMGKFSEIKMAILNILQKLNQMLSDMHVAADLVSDEAGQVSQNSIVLAQGATEQASTIQELNATVVTIQEIATKTAESAKEASKLSTDAMEDAKKGNDSMKEMLNSMNGINQSSENIASITKVINDIAFQTNLLAINAAIEAARAGVHGKGFSIVAEEVRSLASKCRDAAEKITLLITESIHRVTDGTKTAATTAEILNTITTDTSKVAEIISFIAEASRKQSSSFSGAADGLTQITEVVQNNSAASEESAAASEQLASQSEVLRGLVNSFSLKK